MGQALSNLPKSTAWNRPFLSYKNSHFQNKAQCKPLILTMSCYLLENKKLLSYQWLCTQPCFETEAWANLKMAYQICMNNAQGAQVAKVHIDYQKNSLIGNHLKQFRNVHCILWHWLSSLSLVAMVVFPSRVGLIHTTRQIWNSL